MSEALKQLQSKCGTTPDGGFGPMTANAIADYYKWSTEQAAHLLGQVVHESGSFSIVTENLNYSADRLQKVFGTRYFRTKEDAKACERQPEKIANIVYNDRYRSEKGKLGNVMEGDGWKFRGRGFLQCTGRNNYQAFAREMKLPEIMTNPDLVATDYAMESAIWFFNRNNLWKICDEGVSDDIIKRLTKRINGGYNGLDHRKKETLKIYEWLS